MGTELHRIHLLPGVLNGLVLEKKRLTVRLAEAGLQVVLQVNDLLKIDARITTCQVARCLCISTRSTYKISTKTIRVSGIAARWIPHSLLTSQKRGRVSIARKNA